MYTTKDGLTKIETTFYEDTVWLSIDQIAELFQCDRSVIVKHVRNIFKDGELDKNSVLAKFAYTATDGKKYNVDCYNLDVIISVGYKKKGTQPYWPSTYVNNYVIINPIRFQVRYIMISHLSNYLLMMRSWNH